jgi:L-asparaginase II
VCKLCWITLLLLLLIVGGAVYKFGFLGSTLPSDDARVAIQLTDSERTLVLSEMRAFLETVQVITEGMVDEEMNKVMLAARKVGFAAQQGVPLSLMGKLPLEFKQLGMDTHRKFDQIAMDAEQLGDVSQTLEQLSVLLRNCAGCHAGYKFVTVAD